MSKLLLSVVLLAILQSINVRANDIWNVGLPSITFDLRSDKEGDLRDVMVEVLQTTRTHLNNHFIKHFEEEEEHGPDYFQHLDLSVKQFAVGGHGRELSQQAKHSVAILYHGFSFYNSADLPDKDLVREIVSESFMAAARTEFINDLVASKDPFLANLQYMVVTINDNVVANEDLAHHSWSTSKSEGGEKNSGTSWALVAAVAGSAVGVLIAIAILIYIWRLNRSKSFLELPEKYPEKYCSNGDEEFNLELKSTQSPSPEKSLISQESSKFTYNPSGGGGRSEGSTLPSQFSELQVDTTPVNVEQWQKSGVSPMTPAPFGADISAIEDGGQVDLSMVEECPSSQERSSMASTAESSSSNASALNYLSKNSLMTLANLERGNLEPPKRKTPTNVYSMSTDDSNVLSEISLNDDGSDVISDLKNLSVQFQQHRGTFT